MHTLELQHSCHPLLEWTEVSSLPGCLSEPDLPKPTDGGNYKSESKTDGSDDHRTDPAKSPDGNNGGDIQGKGAQKDLVGLAVGAVAATGLAIIGAPVAIVVGTGFAIYLVARQFM